VFISWSWQNEMINESTLWSLKMTGQQAYRHFTRSCESISACYWDVHRKTGNVDAEVTNWGTPYVPGLSSSNWKYLRGIKAITPLLFSFRCVSCPRRRQMPWVRLAFVAISATFWSYVKMVWVVSSRPTAFQFGQKSFDSRYRIDFFQFDSAIW